MRSDRRREIQEQLEGKKKRKKDTGANKICRFLSVLYMIAAVAFIVTLWMLNIMPAKYLYPMIGIVIFGSIFIVPVMYSKRGKKGRKIVATLLCIALIGCFGTGIVYLNQTSDFFGEISQETKTDEKFYVLTKKDGFYQEMEQLYGQVIGTYMIADTRYSQAKAVLQELESPQMLYAENLQVVLEKLLAGECQAILVSEAAYESYRTMNAGQEGGLDIEALTKIVYTISIPIEKTEQESKTVDPIKDCFNVYFSGSDMEGSIDVVNRTDVNMIATINPKTHKILLTSIPRDYYVTLPSKEQKDKLTHSSLYGIEETLAAVENHFGIEIQYYVRVNYSTVMALVDAIGGIEIESDVDFYTSGMKGMPELNGLHFVKGTNYVDGKGALAFCRERHSFGEGDMKRNENQQQVLTAILKKASSSKTILTKYTALLDAVKGNMSTNMTQEEMAQIIKMQIADMPNWEISKVAIKGTNNYEYCYSLGFKAATVDGILEEEIKALDNIARIALEEEN